MSLIRETSWGAIGSIANTLGRMLIAVVVGRRLGPELFGTFVFLQWLLEMTFLTCSLGLGGVATRYFPQFTRGATAGISGFASWFMRAGLTAVAMSTAFAVWAAGYFVGITDPLVLVGVAAWAASSSTWALASARAQGLFLFKRVAVSSILFAGLAVTGIFAAVPSAGGNIAEAVIVMGVANCVGAVCCLFRTRLPRNAPAGKSNACDDASVRQYAINVWASSLVSSLVWSRGEVSMIKAEHGDAAVGYYSVALTLAGAINLGVSLLTSAMAPRIMRAWDEGRRSELAAFSSGATDVLSMVAALAAGFVVCFAAPLTVLLFGEAFSRSSALVSILAVGALGVSSGCANAIVQAATNARFTRNITTAGATLLFGGGFVLIHYFGLEGAAFIRSAIQISIAVATLVCLGKVLEDRPGARRNLNVLISLILLLSGLVALISYAHVPHWGAIVLFALYSTAVVAICIGSRRNGIMHNFRELARFGHA
jgi:O-antigen/teichoic acid export membrane protein